MGKNSTERTATCPTPLSSPRTPDTSMPAMMPTPRYQTQDWGLALTLLRFLPGEEQRFKQDVKGHRFANVAAFKILGFYDVALLYSASSFAPEPPSPRSAVVAQSHTALLAPWRRGDGSVLSEKPTWFTQTPMVLLVVANFKPSIELTYSIQLDLAAIDLLEKRIGSDILTAYTTLNHGEIVLFLRGKDINSLLSVVEYQIRTVRVRDLDLPWPTPRSGDAFIFHSTFSYPLISYPEVILPAGDAYSKLEGEVQAVTFSSYAAESDLLSPLALSDSTFEDKRRAYGRADLIALTKGVKPFGEIVKAIVDYRQQGETRSESPIELFATESYITVSEAEFLSRRKEIVDSLPMAENVEITPTQQADEWLDLRDTLTNDLRDAWELLHSASGDAGSDDRPIIEGLSRLQSGIINGLANPRTALDFIDLAPFAQEAQDQVICSLLQGGLDNQQREILTRDLNLAITALRQRRSGLSFALEGAGPTIGVMAEVVGNRTLWALGAAPRYAHELIHNAALANGGASWTGFAVVAQEYKFQYFKGDIYTYPAPSLADPIGSWYVVTHEIAHSVFETLATHSNSFQMVMQEAMANTLDSTLRAGRPIPHKAIQYLATELFAHAFDFLHFFKSDLDVYLPSAWVQWLHLARVWENRTNYLTRSLLVFIAHGDWGIRGPDKQVSAGKALTDRYLAHRDFVSSRLPEKTRQSFQRFDQWDNSARESVVGLAGFLFPVAKAVFAEAGKISRKINDTDGTRHDIVDQQVKRLLAGKLVSEPLADPARTIVQLYRDGDELEPGPRMAANWAALISLAGDSRRRLLAQMRPLDQPYQASFQSVAVD